MWLRRWQDAAAKTRRDAVDVGTVLEQQLDNGCVALVAGSVQGLETSLVLVGLGVPGIVFIVGGVLTIAAVSLGTL